MQPGGDNGDLRVCAMTRHVMPPRLQIVLAGRQRECFEALSDDDEQACARSIDDPVGDSALADQAAFEVRHEGRDLARPNATVADGPSKSLVAPEECRPELR
jgi:hypothetical protein